MTRILRDIFSDYQTIYQHNIKKEESFSKKQKRKKSCLLVSCHYFKTLKCVISEVKYCA